MEAGGEGGVDCFSVWESNSLCVTVELVSSVNKVDTNTVYKDDL
jgi:hypothetical protein